MSILCKMGMHSLHMLAYHVTVIEEGWRKLYVVVACQRCKTLYKRGMAHQREALPTEESTKLPDGWKWGN